MDELCEFFKEDNRAFKRNIFMNVYRAAKEEYNEYNYNLANRLRA
jgi:hypothetical protein